VLFRSEKLSVAGGRYGWISSVTILLGTVLMVIAGVAITAGGVNSLKPIPHNPQIRVVHAAADAPAMDIYLNDTKALSTVGYDQSTALSKVLPGEYEMKLFPVCDSNGVCPDPIADKVKPAVDAVISLAPETATTYVVIKSGESLKLVTVPTDLTNQRDQCKLKGETCADDENIGRLQVINASSAPASLIRVDPNERLVDPKDRKPPEVLVADLASGTASQALVLSRGQYNLAWSRNGQRFGAQPDYTVVNKTYDLIILNEEKSPTGEVLPVVLHAAPLRTAESFGSPQQMGLEMLSTYLLPFELVSLLLLAAMVGAIILTREDTVKRVRQRIKVSGTAAQLNRAMRESGAAGSSTAASSPASGAESSAD